MTVTYTALTSRRVCLVVAFAGFIAATIASATTAQEADRPSAGDILNQQLKSKSQPTPLSVGIQAVWVAPTEHTEFGYGLAAPVELSHFSPLIIQANIQLHWSDLKRIFPGQNFYALSFDLALLFRPQYRHYSPYLGVGYGYTKQSWPGECNRDRIVVIYDEYDIPCGSSIDLGDDFYPKIKAGVLTSLSDRVSLALDLDYSLVKPSVPVVVTTFPSGNQFDLETSYDGSTMSVRMGILVQLFRSQ